MFGSWHLVLIWRNEEKDGVCAFVNRNLAPTVCRQNDKGGNVMLWCHGSLLI